MLEVNLAPLVLTTGNFAAGDTVRVTVSFQYRVGVDTNLALRAAPYYANLFGKHLVSACVGQTDLLLEPSSEAVEKTAAVDIALTPSSLGGIENGAYGLVVWLRSGNSTADPWTLPSPLARAEQDNVLVVSGNSSGGITNTFSSLMPMLMLMLGMIGPMLSGGEE